MPTARSNWRPSTIQVVGAVSVANWLAALNDLLVAEAAANPTTAIWGVSYYDAADRVLEIKKRLVTDDVRMLFFGGATPNAAAMADSQLVAADMLYGLCCPTAGTTGPDALPTVGNPYTELSTLGIAMAKTGAAGQASANRIRYFENDDCFVLLVHNETSSAHTGFFMGGNLLDDPDGNPVYGISASGASTSTSAASSQPLQTSALTAQFGTLTNDKQGRFWQGSNASLSSSTAGFPGTRFLKDGTSRRGLGIPTYCYEAGNFVSMLKNEASTKSYMIPIPFVSASPAEFLGHLRQVMVGPRAALGTVLAPGGTPKAYAVSANPSGVADALWLEN
jgi:hypothetical protein